jgi:hypothetical protein
MWGEPFTLPVTAANWPARYTGALDPATHPDSVLAARDILECRQRLGTLDLVGGMSTAAEDTNFAALRAECKRLVQGWPGTPNYAVGLSPSDDATAAPQLSLSLVSQLQLSALSPYLARVLGLYFVDAEAKHDEEYQYCIAGLWADTVPPQVLSPGGAPPAALARGTANFDGMTITADPGVGHLYAWQGDGTGSGPPAQLPGVPAAVTAALTAATAGLGAGQLPPALLAAMLNPPRWPFLPTPLDATVCTIALATPVAEVAIGLAGDGTVTASSGGAQVATAAFSAATLTWYSLATADPATAPIDQLTITGTGGAGSVVVVGAIATSPVTDAAAGLRYALVNVPAPGPAPGPMPAPSAPGPPVTIFRYRAGRVDPATVTIMPSSFFEVQWVPPPTAATVGDPVTDPAALPAPWDAVGYLAEREDSGQGTVIAISRLITATPQPTPAGSPLLPAPAILRFTDTGLPDPVTGYRHRVAGFGVFGQRGDWSGWGEPRGVERIAAAPSLRLVTGGATQSLFDNSPAGGGAPDNPASPAAWVGGTLRGVASWPASALLIYPDARTSRLTVSGTDPATTLTTSEFAVPAPSVSAYTLSQLVAGPAGSGVTYAITTPPLTAIAATDPAASLTLTGVLSDGTAVTERFAVRPGQAPPSAGIQQPVAAIVAGLGSRVVTNPGAFLGRPAYLVSGVSVPFAVRVPLSIPIAATGASGTAVAGASTKDPYDPAEQITDPNTGATRPEPPSNTVTFTAAQQLTPPQPTPIDQGTPTHIVHHRYYDPADANGNATATVPFTIAGQPGVSGYLLYRAAAQSLFIADLTRRLTAGLLDPNPAIPGRPDLATWIGLLPQWLASYNYQNGTALTEVTVLSSAAGQRGLISHFYGGLLDDELRALADVPANTAAFAQVASGPAQPSGTPLTDTVNGNGFGRNLYGLRSVNPAGARGPRTPSYGPVYTRTINASRPPVLYTVTSQPTSGALIVAWALDASPDIAGYLVYRAPFAEPSQPSGLTDLRWFGPDPVHPADPATLALPTISPGAWRPLSLTAGAGDPRLIGVVGDPRAFARDYEGSDMGEVALPPGTPPDEIHGVYRLDEFDPATPGSQPGAFNYWIPAAAGGTAQLVTDATVQPAASRVTGLRLGLGRGVAVAVVASYAGTLRVVGTQPVLRIAFVDGVQPGTAGSPADSNAAPTWTQVPAGVLPAYAIVAVDIAGNLSAPSAPLSPPAFAPA